MCLEFMATRAMKVLLRLGGRFAIAVDRESLLVLWKSERYQRIRCSNGRIPGTELFIITQTRGGIHMKVNGFVLLSGDRDSYGDGEETLAVLNKRAPHFTIYL